MTKPVDILAGYDISVPVLTKRDALECIKMLAKKGYDPVYVSEVRLNTRTLRKKCKRLKREDLSE